MLVLSAVAAVLLHGRAGAAAPAPPAADESPLGRIPEIQKKLNERIDYELVVTTTLDKVLDSFLRDGSIAWTVNEAALKAANLNPDVVRKTEIEKLDKMTGVTRATVLKRLLAKIPSDNGKGTPTYILRRDCLEITTEWAKVKEAQGARAVPDEHDAPTPLSLAYGEFHGVPLHDALQELARTTENNIVLDARCAAEGKAKVTADFAGVPVDAALQLLADMADLKLVRIANVYYVTSPKNARLLQKEEDKRKLETARMRAVDAWTQLAKAWLPEPLQIGLSGPGPLNGRK
jgi:hypothetical protein